MKALVGCLNCALKGVIAGVFYSKTPDGQICCPILKCCAEICIDRVKVGIEENADVEMTGELHRLLLRCLRGIYEYK